MSISSYTNNFNLGLVNFGTSPWHDDEHNNWIAVDTLLNTVLAVANYEGIWLNSTAYIIDQVTLDNVVGGLFTCLVDHTSHATDAFSVDRTNNPTYWEPTTFSNSSSLLNFDGGTR